MFRRLLILSAILACSVPVAAFPQSKNSKSASRKPAATAGTRITSGKNSASKNAANNTAVDQSLSDVEPVNSGVFLLRDPLVQNDLKLSAEQSKAAAQLAAEFNDSIWRFRDASIESPVAQREARLINAEIEPRLRKLLSPMQLDRLTGIILQTQGTSSLSYGSTAERLVLTSDQRRQIAQLNSASQAAVKTLQDKSPNTDSAETNRLVQKQLVELQTDLQGVLTAAQRARWQELAGDPLDLQKLRPLTAQAPELRNVTAWINAEPFELRQLRGKVVILHFYTFGCINCIHNYPSYRNWLQKFQKRDVTIVGIHAPETEGEKDIQQIERKAGENGLAFPIVVDNDLKNWQAWSNTIWPAVYLIDKQGFVRYWWYGELNWQGAVGEQYMGDKVRELIAEK
jgi:peroxiredoxin